MEKQPVLSLCIPTNGAVEWILPVIDSIYSQKYDNEKFEVVITDNGKDSHLPEHIAKMEYPNLRYKQTTDEGFLNLVTCLKEGKGLFCKMINHRSVLEKGSIEKLVSLVEIFKDKQPIIYCSSGWINCPEMVECKTIDEFLCVLSYWCSWSAGIGFWEKDVAIIDEVILNEMFPNTSLLFNIRTNSEYVVWNYPYQRMDDDTGKGGYDLFETFGVVLLDLINELRINKRIKHTTFAQVKFDLYKKLCYLYRTEVIEESKHTFIIRNIKESLSVYYGNYYYWKMIVLGWMGHVYGKVKFFPLRFIRCTNKKK